MPAARPRREARASRSSPRPGCGPRPPKAFARWQDETSRVIATFSGFIKQTVDAPQPAPAGRLGHPSALRQRAGGEGVAQVRGPAPAHPGCGAPDPRRGRRPSRARRRTCPAARPRLGGDLHAHQARPRGGLSTVGAAHRGGPGQGRRIPGLPGPSRPSPACRMTGRPSCASTRKQISTAWLDSPERQKLLEEAGRVHPGFRRPHRADGLRPVVPHRGRGHPRPPRPGSRT